MKDNKRMSRYAMRIIQNLKPKLRSDVDVSITVYPAEQGGGVVEVQLIPNAKASARKRKSRGIKILPVKATINDVLEVVPQRIVSGNLKGVQFQGTNISLENNRIVLIKGDNEYWTENDADSDVGKIINHKVES